MFSKQILKIMFQKFLNVFPKLENYFFCKEQKLFSKIDLT